ncbi:RT0821/Lpp0805 family surface protein [Mesorhizobium sp. NBSH29]|uniref:RT0821/Lpp0805 family surface protein n=1 Tax=Mesorhizobium sp. NBSH29 TaxID=2654249 RepID=UPI0021563228|nr:RT0821/Lpp0805 family surface protein [Mesorhizobium sp. NBSH29]
MAFLSGCASGLDLRNAEVDRTLYTSAVSTDSQNALDQGQLSDAATIRNAVSSADVELAGGQALAWANADTGSRGSITGLTEYRDGGSVCRRFQAMRESFDGVKLYRGDACQAAPGAWQMRSFESK